MQTSNDNLMFIVRLSNIWANIKHKFNIIHQKKKVIQELFIVALLKIKTISKN